MAAFIHDLLAFTDLVPTGVRKATDKEVTKEMNALAKSLRDPLNWLNICLNRAEAKELLANAQADFGLGNVRHEISTRDVEGLDGALNTLLQLLQEPKNAAALTAQGHTPTDTKALTDARAHNAKFNETQNTNQDSAVALTIENITAGNNLWHYVGDALATGNLMYKETNPKKADTFTMASLLKRIRNEGGKRQRRSRCRECSFRIMVMQTGSAELFSGAGLFVGVSFAKGPAKPFSSNSIMPRTIKQE